MFCSVVFAIGFAVISNCLRARVCVCVYVWMHPIHVTDHVINATFTTFMVNMIFGMYAIRSVTILLHQC